jgi:ABC-type ATPase involved in cell division
LIADEPTAHQDDQGAAMIIDKFSEWKLPDTIVVVAAHDSRWAEHGKFVDKHLLLENERIRELQ